MKYLNIILVAILMVACKSSEQAYRNSYQKMVGAEGASAAKTISPVAASTTVTSLSGRWQPPSNAAAESNESRKFLISGSSRRNPEADRCAA